MAVTTENTVNFLFSNKDKETFKILQTQLCSLPLIHMATNSTACGFILLNTDIYIYMLTNGCTYGRTKVSDP